jgi:hypothetical protein
MLGAVYFVGAGIRIKVGTYSYFETFEYELSSYFLIWAGIKKRFRVEGQTHCCIRGKHNVVIGVNLLVVQYLLQHYNVQSPPLPSTHFFSGCLHEEIGWPFLFKGLTLGACSYFCEDSATGKNLLM